MHKGFICYSLIAIFSFVFLCTSISYADDVAKDPVKEYWDAIAKRSDATITITKDPLSGKEIKHAKFKGGVEISSDGESTIGMDTSGLGAVLCLRELILGVQLTLKECPPKDQSLSTETVDKLVHKIDQFIVDNSILPVTFAEIEASKIEMQKRYEGIPRPVQCNTKEIEGIKEMWTNLNEVKSEEFDKMLSVPRPPVLNPCL